MPINPKRVKEIFLEAAELSDEAARAAYLDRACGGDAGLRDRVEALLRAHDPAGSFLGTPAVAVPDPDHDGTMAFDSSDRDGVSPIPDHDDESDGLPFLSPSTRPDSLGRLGHYEMLQLLGRGGFGIVFRAFDDMLQRVVAVKVMAPQIATLSPARKRFLREARSSAAVRHENVVQVYDVGEQPLPYLVMEFIPGETLQQKLDRTGPLDVSEVLRIGRQIAEGLAAAHAQGLIHRDIKPGNILLEAGPNPHVKITDFGLARAADDASLTQSGTIAGTPMFMAPEQAHGDTLDQRADLFSLGSVLYTMASGRPPFRANNTLAVLKRVAEDTPRPIPEIIPEVPPWLCDLIARLHAKKPEDRIGTAKEVADLLARGLEALQRAAKFPSLPAAAPVAVAKVPREARASGGTVELPGPAPTVRPRFYSRRWAAAAAAMLLALFGGFSYTEATGVTNVRGTVIRLFSPEGTLEIQVDDPGVSVQIDGSDLVITGAGASEIRLKPGSYTVKGIKDGKVVSRELVTVTKDGKQVVRVSQEGVVAKGADSGGEGADPKTAPPGKKPPVAVRPPVPTVHDTWIRALAALPLDQQGAALVAKMNERLPGFEDAFLNQMATMPADRQVFLLTVWLTERNPGFDGKFTHKIEDGMVTSLDLPAPIVQDLTPLRALINLRTLTCRTTVGYDNKAETDTAVLGSLEALEKINDKPVAQFWKVVKARQADFQEFLKVVSALTAEQQVAAVATRLKEHNPGFGGQVASKIEGGVVTEIGIQGNVTDLSPLRALAGLKVLSCSEAPLSDLAPLKGLKLTSLGLAGSQVSDLSPLKGMPLTSLGLDGCRLVRDLSPLKGLSLTSLGLAGSQVSDLSPLKGMPLTYLNLHTCSQVQDLAPLKGMPLTYLNLHDGPNVGDLSPLKGMPLTLLYLGGDRVRDLSPLKDMPLTSLSLSHCSQVQDLSPLKGMKLTLLFVTNTQVRDLEPLKDMPLEQLYVDCPRVTDLRPLQGMQLELLCLTPNNITQGLGILRDMKSLTAIGINHYAVWPAAEFWARYDKGEFTK